MPFGESYNASNNSRALGQHNKIGQRTHLRGLRRRWPVAQAPGVETSGTSGPATNLRAAA